MNCLNTGWEKKVGCFRVCMNLDIEVAMYVILKEIRLGRYFHWEFWKINISEFQ